MKKILLLIAFIIPVLASTSGQGWERVYGGSGQDEGRAIAKTPDGGYIIAGYYNAATWINLLKVDADGNLQWNKQLSFNANKPGNVANAIVVAKDGGYVLAGYCSPGTGATPRDILLMKVNSFGDKIWQKTFGAAGNDEATGLVETPDGSLVLTGFITQANGSKQCVVLKTNAGGNQLWQQQFGDAAADEQGSAIVRAENTDLVVAGFYQGATPGYKKELYALRVTDAGTFVWQKRINVQGTNDGDDLARAIVAAPNNEFILAGFTNSEPDGAGLLLRMGGDVANNTIWKKAIPKTDFYGLCSDGKGNYFATGYRNLTAVLADLNVVRVDNFGQVAWEAIVGKAGIDQGNAVLPVKDGGVVAVGSSEQFVGVFGQPYVYLVKVDAGGKVFTSYLHGNLFQDQNLDCVQNGSEPPLRDWIVKISNSQNFERFVVAKADGSFQIAVDTGNYKITLFAPNDYWKTCTPTLEAKVTAFYDTVEFHLPVQAKSSCPRNEIDVASPILRRCANNTYTVRYCNSGTIPSVNTFVDVTLDEAMNFAGSSIPGTQIDDKVWRFNLGIVPNGECGSFTVDAFLDCNTLTGQTHCVNAYINPDTFCNITSGWDEAIVVAKAVCQNDSVKMILGNVGSGNMGGPLGFVIAEDVVMLTPPNDPSNQFQLSAGEESIVWTTPANGKTYRIIAEQSPGYPGAGYPTAAVEGCKSDTASNDISLGFYTMFPEDEQSRFRSADCQESYETDYHPEVLKRGHPKGYDGPHYVDLKTDLDYLIQFRNNGADTVQQVIVRDTLSAALDPASVLPGSSSHDYQFEVYGTGIVQFTLGNINLAPGKEGFVTFRASQKQDLPCKTVIYNKAEVYFDFSSPEVTDLTYHTVCEFDTFIVITGTRQIFVPGAELKVYPNPASGEFIQFELNGVDAGIYTLELFDAQGRLLTNRFFNHPNFQLIRHLLPEGLIFYRLAADGKPVASGKLILR